MWKSQDRWKGHALFIFTTHVNSSLNSQNVLWHVITNYIFIWTITGSIMYIFHEPFIRFPHFSTFLVTPWGRFLLEKSTSSQLVKKFPTFYGTQSSLPHLQVRATCPYPKPDQSRSCPHPTSWRSILILSSYLLLGLPCGLFPSGFLTKTLYTHLISPIHATFPTHLLFLDLITQKHGVRSADH